MILPLFPDTDPALRMECPTFDFKHPIVAPAELADNLIETMRHHKAMGLAANQCGMPLRVFVIDGNPPKICFNPKIVYSSEELALLVEGCLTYPDLWIKVKRPDNIRVRYQDEVGEVHTEMLGGYNARCFLHELDHLNGVTFIERASTFHLEQAKRKQKELRRRKG